MTGGAEQPVLHPRLLTAEQLFSLAGRHALVTGGSSGIGRVAALAFAAQGADVSFTYAAAVDERLGLQHAADEVRGHLGDRGRSVDLDLTASREVVLARMVEVQGHAPVDILVLNASVQIPERLEEISEAALVAQMRINFENTVWLLQHLVPPMVERGWGRVIAISSVQEVQPRETMPVYAALKAALGNLMRNLARAHARDGVTFNTILPGLIATSRNLWRDDPARTAEWQSLARRINPMARAGTGKELAGTLLLLAAPSSSFTTGAEIMVTGGGHIP